MKFRVKKVARIVGPIALVAVLFIGTFYTWAMHGILVNQVAFAGIASQLSNKDKAQIRQLVLHDPAIAHPPKNRLIRFKITFNKKQPPKPGSAVTIYSGTIHPNTALVSEGLVSVSQDNGPWRIIFLAYGE